MLKKTAFLTVFTAVIAGCGPDNPTAGEVPSPPPDELMAASTPAVTGDSGLIRKTLPDEDPGPPFYARVTTILNQLFHDDGWLAIPFYRPPSCVPDDFNLLALYDPPGPEGPGAFACPLLATGFLLIEPDAPLGTFPRQAVFTGGAVPFWFVDWDTFQAEAADGVVTFAELEAMDPVTGVAERYHETLKPRTGDHVVIINAAGALDDGGRFQFHVTHLQDETQAVRIRLR